ncbi:MAG: hypothetical protein ACJ72N_17950 [Labedaea sp.]
MHASTTTTQLAFFLLSTGLLGAVAVGLFRLAEAMIDPAVVRERDVDRIRRCYRLSPVVLAVSALLAATGGVSLTL